MNKGLLSITLRRRPGTISGFEPVYVPKAISMIYICETE
jgi:hypothetical protein